MDERPPWHVLRCTYGTEIAVAGSCEDGLGIEVYCPRYEITWTRRGKRQSKTIPFLGTYVFARFQLDDHLWHDIHGIDGVIEILGGAMPGAVTEKEIDILRGQIGQDGKLVTGTRIILSRIKPGDRVIFTEGPFAGVEAVCLSIDDDVLIDAEISLLGRTIRVTLPSAYCDPISHAGPETATSIKRAHRGRRGKRQKGDSLGVPKALLSDAGK